MSRKRRLDEMWVPFIKRAMRRIEKELKWDVPNAKFISGKKTISAPWGTIILDNDLLEDFKIMLNEDFEDESLKIIVKELFSRLLERFPLHEMLHLILEELNVNPAIAETLCSYLTNKLLKLKKDFTIRDKLIDIICSTPRDLLEFISSPIFELIYQESMKLKKSDLALILSLILIKKERIISHITSTLEISEFFYAENQ
jgi:hypothetical protein